MRLPALLAVFAALGLEGFAPSSPPGTSRIPLREEVKTEGLPRLITTNHLGLGAEAQGLVPWILAHPGPLTLRAADGVIEDAKAGSIRVSPVMARTLIRLSQWHGLEAPKGHPITHAQLEAAALSKGSVNRIRAIFEEAIARGVRIGPKWLTPETGGEATIDAELRLAEARDPRWATIQDLVKVSDDVNAIAARCESRAEEIALVDAHGLLKVAVARLRLGAPGSPEEVRRALLTVAQNAAPTYSLGEEEQLALVTGADWRGRYVGGWHTHAPHDANGEWVGGDVPSFEDMQNAVQYGQYLTLSFQPDGFDLYDADALGDAKRVDLKLLKVIRYRSPAWREHFAALRPRAR
jgi:hypothetical protein